MSQAFKGPHPSLVARFSMAGGHRPAMDFNFGGSLQSESAAAAEKEEGVKDEEKKTPSEENGPQAGDDVFRFKVGIS